MALFGNRPTTHMRRRPIGSRLVNHLGNKNNDWLYYPSRAPRRKGEDYDRLHEAMEAQGFKRSITSDDGVAYDLPTAEYYYEGNVTRNNVLEKTKVAAEEQAKSTESW